MKIEQKSNDAMIALVVYAAVMGLVKGGVLSRQMMSLITPVCVYVMMSVSAETNALGFLGRTGLDMRGFHVHWRLYRLPFPDCNEGYPAGSGEPASGCFYWRVQLLFMGVPIVFGSFV